MRIILNTASLKTICLIIILPAVVELETHADSKKASILLRLGLKNESVTNTIKMDNLNEPALVSILNKTHRNNNSQDLKNATIDNLTKLKEKVYEALNDLKEKNSKKMHLKNDNNQRDNPTMAKWKEILTNASQRIYENNENRGMFKDIVDSIKSDYGKDQNIDRGSIKLILNDMDNIEKGSYRRDENPLHKWKASTSAKTVKLTTITKPKKKKVEKSKKRDKTKKQNKNKMQGRQGYEDYYENPEYNYANYYNGDAKAAEAIDDDDKENVKQEPDENTPAEETTTAEVEPTTEETLPDVSTGESTPISTTEETKETAAEEETDAEPTTGEPYAEETKTEEPTNPNNEESNTGEESTTKKHNAKAKPCSNIGKSDAKHRMTTDYPGLKEDKEVQKYQWKFIKDRIGHRRQDDDSDDEKQPFKLHPECCDCCQHSDFGCT